MGMRSCPSAQGVRNGRLGEGRYLRVVVVIVVKLICVVESGGRGLGDAFGERGGGGKPRRGLTGLGLTDVCSAIMEETGFVPGCLRDYNIGLHKIGTRQNHDA